MTRLQKFLSAIGIVIVVALGFIIFKQETTITLTKTQLQAITDTLRITKNKYGQEVATRQSLSGDLKNVQTELALAKAPKELQALAKDKSITTGIVSSTTTKIDTSVLLAVNDIKKDTIKSDSAVAKIIHENFIKTITNPWYDAIITKTDDSLGLGLNVRNKYVYSVKKSGDKYTLSQTNLNPYTHTDSLQSYTITPEPAKNGKWFLIGSGVGAGVILFILHLFK